MAHEFIGGDADEAGSQAALGRECGLGALADLGDRTGHFHVLGEIEIMEVEFACHFRHRRVAKIGQAGDHCIRTVGLRCASRACFVGGIHPVGMDVGELIA